MEGEVARMDEQVGGRHFQLAVRPVRVSNADDAHVLEVCLDAELLESFAGMVLSAVY